MTPGTAERMRRAASQVLSRQVATGSEAYSRSRSLWRLLPQAAVDRGEGEPARTRTIILALLQAIRRERRLGRGGHWSYDLNRHIALAQALAAERAMLAALEADNVRNYVRAQGSCRPSPPQRKP